MQAIDRLNMPPRAATPAVRRPALRLAALLATAAAVAPAGEALAEPAPMVTAASPTDPLWMGFRDPPKDAKPYIWWHWLNGNVSEDGLKADLEWMARVGIGGAQQFDAGGPVANFDVIEPRVAVGSAAWQSAVGVAARTADRLGIELGTATSPGWSETGGPWVTPDQAMKKYVWSETLVGHGSGRIRLPLPPTVAGVFQNAPPRGWLGGGTATPPSFYRDAKVVAYRLPQAERPELVPLAVIAGDGQAVDPDKLRDGDVAAMQSVHAAPGEKVVTLTARFARPVTIRAISLGIPGAGSSEGPVKPRVAASMDGRNWGQAVDLTGPADAPLKTYTLAPMTGRFFRVFLPESPPPPLAISLFQPPRPPGVFVELSELVLHTEGMIDRFAEKAGFSEPINFEEVATPKIAPEAVISPRNVVDLTGRMAADGTLDWTPPAGRWRIIRLGYSLTGQQNGPAPAEATGLEVDKFDPAHIRTYLAEHVRRYEAAVGTGMTGEHGLRNMIADSWEAGAQNWTEAMPAEFAARRGYELTPWIPALTGRVVGSAADSERFLWDFRRTQMDLLARHYDVVREALHARGLKFYAEAQGDTWRAMADGMEIKSRADIPMSEYWYKGLFEPGQPALKADMKEASSVAHLYGKRLAATESLTIATSTPWAYSPAMLKPVIDDIFAHGINRIVLHSSVHQPYLDRKPGLTLGLFGQYLNRNETWAELAGPFMRYIARSSQLLQQGNPVADIAYFYGEQRPLANLFKGRSDPATGRLTIEVPDGYGYDFVNAESLRKASNAADGSLTVEGHSAYRVLYLGPDSDAMTLATITQIETLVRGGLTLVGERPTRILGLTGSQRALEAAADRIWGPAGASGPRQVGAGKVIPTRDLAGALKGMELVPDVALDGFGGAYVLQVHRRLDDGREIYFLTNRENRPIAGEIAFRSRGRAPELWDADKASTRALPFRMADQQTSVPLRLGPLESAFIVFNHPATGTMAGGPVDPPDWRQVAALRDGWSVSFPDGASGTRTATFDTLGSWSDRPEADVRYFSGTGTYRRSFAVNRAWRRARERIILSLGEVHELARVRVNGREFEPLWKSPFEVDITEAVHTGNNDLEIEITNLWPNRIIGDLQPGDRPRSTWAPVAPHLERFAWKAESKLLPSGLLGPVTVRLENSLKSDQNSR